MAWGGSQKSIIMSVWCYCFNDEQKLNFFLWCTSKTSIHDDWNSAKRDIMGFIRHIQSACICRVVMWSVLFQFRNFKIVYRRYAGLYFCICVDITDNNLAYLEAIHNFVEVLNEYFHNVCELDLVFNFYKVCFLATWWSMGNAFGHSSCDCGFNSV